MLHVRPYISSFEIAEKIKILADQLNQKYREREDPLVLVFILKGAICFVADLIRELKFPFVLEPIQTASYGQSGTIPTTLEIFGIERLDLAEKEVLLIDDIFDRGQTLKKVVEELKKLDPKSLSTLVLLRKKRAANLPLQPDHALFEIEDDFVVGYGLDYKEAYRGLPEICLIDKDNS